MTHANSSEDSRQTYFIWFLDLLLAHGKSEPVVPPITL